MKLLWLDLETTGLNPRADNILEIAVSVADFATPFVAVPALHRVIRSRGSIEDEFVRKMHSDNGLLKEAAAPSASPLCDVEAELVRLFSLTETYFLAGFSVHFDHSFLNIDMPGFASCLSHRHYDVSSIKLFCQSLGMLPLPKGSGTHRAREDVLEAVAHAKLCEGWLKEYSRIQNLGLMG